MNSVYLNYNKHLFLDERFFSTDIGGQSSQNSRIAKVTILAFGRHIHVKKKIIEEHSLPGPYC